MLVDKPKDWTSFDVVNKIRYTLKQLLGVKKIKVGHAGTLDPMATGLLIINTGRKTKEINLLQDLDKSYEGTIRLGATTPSYDAETEIDQNYPYEHISLQQTKEAIQRFIGDSQQKPPMFSAIKKDGVRLYKLARKGVEVEVPLRNISIDQFDINRFELPEVDFTVSCSKGTYVRSLAYDLGQALDSGGYLTRLVRTRIGTFSLEEAYSLDELISTMQNLGQ